MAAQRLLGRGRPLVLLALAALALMPAVLAFYLAPAAVAPPKRTACQAVASSSSSSDSSSSNRRGVSRRDLGAVVMPTAAAAAVFGLGLSMAPAPVLAAADEAKKGTKDDPEYQKCMSVCMYRCTKPKGAEQRSRQECLPDCKEQCAKTKAQMLIGKPKE